MALLSKAEFEATMADPMTKVEEPTPLPAGFWEYVRVIPDDDFDGFRHPGQEIFDGWRDPTGRWDHVLLDTRDPNVFMVVLIDRSTVSIHGHHPLNLRAHYGLDDPPDSP